MADKDIDENAIPSRFKFKLSLSLLGLTSQEQPDKCLLQIATDHESTEQQNE